MREYAVLFREHYLFYSLDDKHRIKSEEPNVQVAAAERGRRVLTAPGSELIMTLQSSVLCHLYFFLSKMYDISGSCCLGKVHISLNEGTFNPSSPIRHATELISLISSDVQPKPVYFYTLMGS